MRDHFSKTITSMKGRRQYEKVSPAFDDKTSDYQSIQSCGEESTYGVSGRTDNRFIGGVKPRSRRNDYEIDSVTSKASEGHPCGVGCSDHRMKLARSTDPLVNAFG